MPRSSESRGTSGARLNFGVTPFGRPCRINEIIINLAHQSKHIKQSLKWKR